MADRVVIEGKEYANGKKAAKALGVSYSTVIDRLNSPNRESWYRKNEELEISINGVRYRDINKAIAKLCVIQEKQNRRGKSEVKKEQNKLNENGRNHVKGNKTYVPIK